MEKEVSSVINLAVMLLSVSIVIGLVVYTIIIGNEFKEASYEKASNLATELESGQLQGLCNLEDVVMTKAAIFSILSKEHNAINSLTFDGSLMVPNAGGKWVDRNNRIAGEYIYPEDVLSKDLNGKVTVTVTRNIKSTYDIIVTTSNIYGL